MGNCGLTYAPWQNSRLKAQKASGVKRGVRHAGWGTRQNEQVFANVRGGPPSFRPVRDEAVFLTISRAGRGTVRGLHGTRLRFVAKRMIANTWLIGGPGAIGGYMALFTPRENTRVTEHGRHPLGSSLARWLRCS